MNKVILSIVAGLFVFNEAYGVIHGTVADESEESLAGVEIRYFSPDSALVGISTTDPSGRFELSTMAAKGYYLTFTLTGYNPAQLKFSRDDEHIDVGMIYMRPTTNRLGEVTVRGERIITRSDKYIAYPDENSLKHSTSSLDLLSRMSLPGLEVDIVQRSASIYGTGVIYKINGVTSSLDQVLALSPRNIARVDYTDVPTAKYLNDGIGGIIEIWLTQRETGGSVYQNIGEDVTSLGGDNMTSLTYFSGKSSFRLNYSATWTRHNDIRFKSTETFLDNANPAFISRECDQDNPSKNHIYYNKFIGSYTLDINPDNLIDISAGIDWSNNIYDNPGAEYSKTIGQMPPITATEDINSHTSQLNYSAKINYIRNASRPERTIDASIEFGGTDSKYDYNSQLSLPGSERFYNLTKSSPRVLDAALQWNFPVKSLVMAVGADNYYAWSSNRYSGTWSGSSSLSANTLNVYYSLSGNIGKKLNYSIQAGLKYYSFHDGNENSDDVKGNYMGILNYTPFTGFRSSFSANYYNMFLGLGSRDDYFRINDDMTASKGNPALKNPSLISLRLNNTYNKGPWSAYLSFQWSRGINEAMTNVTYEAPYYVYQYISVPHSDIFHYRGGLTYTWNPRKDLSLRSSGTFVVMDSDFDMPEGKESATYFYGTVRVDLSYKAFNLGAVYYAPGKSIRGYNRSESESVTALFASYTWRNATFVLQLTHPFYDYGSRQVSHFSNNALHSYSFSGDRDLANRVNLRFQYQLDFGKKRSIRQPSLNIGADAEKVSGV